MATYIKQGENEMNFPFNLIYVINQAENIFFCLFARDTQNPRRPIASSHTQK